MFENCNRSNTTTTTTTSTIPIRSTRATRMTKAKHEELIKKSAHILTPECMLETPVGSVRWRKCRSSGRKCEITSTCSLSTFAWLEKKDRTAGKLMQKGSAGKRTSTRHGEQCWNVKKREETLMGVLM